MLKRLEILKKLLMFVRRTLFAQFLATALFMTIAICVAQAAMTPIHSQLESLALESLKENGKNVLREYWPSETAIFVSANEHFESRAVRAASKLSASNIAAMVDTNVDEIAPLKQSLLFFVEVSSSNDPVIFEWLNTTMERFGDNNPMFNTGHATEMVRSELRKSGVANLEYVVENNGASQRVKYLFWNSHKLASLDAWDRTAVYDMLAVNALIGAEPIAQKIRNTNFHTFFSRASNLPFYLGKQEISSDICRSLKLVNFILEGSENGLDLEYFINTAHADCEGSQF